MGIDINGLRIAAFGLCGGGGIGLGFAVGGTTGIAVAALAGVALGTGGCLALWPDEDSDTAQLRIERSHQRWVMRRTDSINSYEKAINAAPLPPVPPTRNRPAGTAGEGHDGTRVLYTVVDPDGSKREIRTRHRY